MPWTFSWSQFSWVDPWSVATRRACQLWELNSNIRERAGKEPGVRSNPLPFRQCRWVLHIQSEHLADILNAFLVYLEVLDLKKNNRV